VAKYVTAIRKLDTWECACPFTCSELEMYPDSLHYAPDRCVINYLKEGSEGEKSGALGLAWFAAVLSIFMFIFYTWQFYTATCGWEVVFVSIMEGLYYVADIFFHDQIPFTLFLADGATVPMVRYTEWLLTCPVLLIHLSNITGLQDEYSPRTMKVLTADQGTLIFGILAAMSSKGLKIFFFLCGATFGVTTFYTAAQIYIEAYYQVPKGQPQKAVRWMTWSYFMSWPLFPVFFLAGPVGFGHLNKHGDSIAHAIIDMLSKNLWGILGWYLRYTIHVHIAMNGHHTKRVRTMIMGQEKEISVFAEEGEHDAVTHSSRALTTRRKSIERLARQLRAKGKKTRTSLDLDDEETNGGWQAGQRPPRAPSAATPGRSCPLRRSWSSPQWTRSSGTSSSASSGSLRARCRLRSSARTRRPPSASTTSARTGPWSTWCSCSPRWHSSTPTSCPPSSPTAPPPCSSPARLSSAVPSVRTTTFRVRPSGRTSTRPSLAPCSSSSTRSDACDCFAGVSE